MAAAKRTSRSWYRTPLFCVTPLGVLITLAGAVLMAGLLFLFRGALLVSCIALLTEDPPVRRADVLFLLGGDATSTVDHSASIYPQVQPRVILISPVRNARLMALRLAKVHGIPESEIHIPKLETDKSPGSTYDEAQIFREYCERETIGSATIVTNLSHTGRAYWIFRRVVPEEIEIRMSAAPEEGFRPELWWQSENGLLTVQNEFLKWIYYYWEY